MRLVATCYPSNPVRRARPLPKGILSTLFARAGARKPRLGLFGKASAVDETRWATYADEWDKPDEVDEKESGKP